MQNLKFALIGNPNSGKTTLFNALTGSHYRVGNRPGVTVECKEGVCRYRNHIKIIDLPGIYSLSPNSAEEAITRDYILNENPDLILNIVDATNLERNLYLSTQLAETGIPMVIALNMIDALEDSGLDIDYKKLSDISGIEIVPISASRGIGIRELTDAAERTAGQRRHAAKKAVNADMRYKLIKAAVSKCVTKTGINRQSERTEKIDSIVTHKFFAIPIFAAVMFAVFEITFGAFGTSLSEYADYIFNVKFSSAAEIFLNNIGMSSFARRLIIEGIFSGVGGVVTFFPQIMLLFLFLSFLEDSGYMARAAFIMDKFFTKLGLSGKSFIPLIIGFGCTVPAALSVRTLENERDRRLTLLLLPFMSCGAKMPVYAIFTAALFPGCGGLVIFGLYFSGIILGAIWGAVLSKTVFKGELPPFVLEMPPYRIPTVKSTLRHMLDKTKEFAQKAGTVLLTASVIIWLMQNLDFTLHITADSSKSIIGQIGRIIAPIFIPCGFGNWEAAVSLLSGAAAKEAIISTMSILYGAADTSSLAVILKSIFTPVQGLAFLAFVLLYVPCIAAVTAIETELNSKKLTALFICCQLVIAWTASMLVYQIGSLIY